MLSTNYFQRNIPTIPLHNGEIDPRKRELLQQHYFVLSAEVPEFAKACIERELASDGFGFFGIACHEHIECHLTIFWI